MFGKVMSIPDKAMDSYARLVTRWTMDEINAFEAAVEIGEIHPRDAKMKLAKEITSAFFDDAQAEAAQENFITLFQKGDMPDDISEYQVKGEPVLLEVLLDSGLVQSKSEGRRMVQQNGVKVDGETASDPFMTLNLPAVVQVGKRKFIKAIK
jgi:tyrosyl-tRNA synthetase